MELKRLVRQFVRSARLEELGDRPLDVRLLEIALLASIICRGVVDKEM
jgi:hypothetical protein